MTGDFMKIPKLSPEEDQQASYEIMMHYMHPEQKHKHGELIDCFFSDMIKEVIDDSLDLDAALSSKTEDERIIIKKLVQVTLEKLDEDNESGYFGVRKSYDFDGDNWHYVDEIRGQFNHINYFHTETLAQLEGEVTDNNCLWIVVDETRATKSRIVDAKLRQEKERAYDEESYSESLEIHPRYAVKFIKEYYESSSKYDDLIREIFSSDCLDAIYSNTLDMDSFFASDNPMERAIVRLLVPFINNKLYSDARLNDTGIFGVKTTYDEEGNNWIYDDLLGGYFDHANRIYAQTLEELKEKVLDNKGIWFVLDDDLEKASSRRDEGIRDENAMIKNSPSQSRRIIKNFIGEWFSTGRADSYNGLIQEIHTSEMMKSIIDKSLNVDGLLHSYDVIGRMIIRMSIQKMKDALTFARMNNYSTGYFGVIHPEYKSWSYANLVEMEYLGSDECEAVHASSLKELEKKVKWDEKRIWCIFDNEKAENVLEMDRILMKAHGSSPFASIDDYWDSLMQPPLRKKITAEYIERLIEKNRERESFLKIKEKEKLRQKKGWELDDELGMDKKYEKSSDIKDILRKG